MNKYFRGLGYGALLIALSVSVGLLGSCGGKEETAPATTEAPGTATAPIEKAGIETPAAPSTHALLGLMPEGTAVAVAVPNMASVRQNALSIVARFDAEKEFEAKLAEGATEFFSELGVSATSTPEFLEQIGIDATAPMAVFVSFDESAASAKTFIEENRERLEGFSRKMSEMKSKTDAEGLEAFLDGVDNPEVTEEPTEETTETETEEEEDATEAEMKALWKEIREEHMMPDFAVVATCGDAATARAKFDEIIAKSPRAAEFDAQTIEHAGQTLTCFDPEYCTVFTSDGYLVVSNDLDMAKAIADAVASPVAIDYDTPKWPQSNADEMVLAYRLDKILPLIELNAEVQTILSPEMAAFQTAILEDMRALYSSSHLLFSTLAIKEDGIDMRMRIEEEKHPELMAYTGSGTPFKLAKALPDDTLVMLGLQINDTMHQNIQKQFQQAMTAAQAANPDAAAPMAMASGFMGFLKGELVAAVTGFKDGMPQAALMLSNDQVEALRGMLMLVPAQPGGTYNDTVPIMNVQLGLPIPVPLNYAFNHNTFVFATGEEQVTALLKRVDEAATSSAYEGLSSKMDLDKPAYSVLFVREGLVDALNESFGPMLGEHLAPMKELRDISAFSYLEGGWLESEFHIAFQ